MVRDGGTTVAEYLKRKAHCNIEDIYDIIEAVKRTMQAAEKDVGEFLWCFWPVGLLSDQLLLFIIGQCEKHPENRERVMHILSVFDDDDDGDY